MNFMGWEWYYIISMYKYNQFSSFLVLTGTKSQTFSPNWPELRVIRAK